MQKLFRIDEMMIQNIFGGHSGGLVEKIHPWFNLKPSTIVAYFTPQSQETYWKSATDYKVKLTWGSQATS